mmetsp:Transcript_90379/g.170402  ORF Transcript_90379/g.170402 Transcript_90379/m.170402 type:complete len:274 (+) Transcript_90379:85-906(+)
MLHFAVVAFFMAAAGAKVPNFLRQRRVEAKATTHVTSNLQVNGSLGVRRQPLFARASGPTYTVSAANLGDTGMNAGQGVMYGQPGGPGGDCHPKCWWSCGTADCDEVCDPVCAPPQCETACETPNFASCHQTCDPPKCAIVCPTSHCAHGGCPKCKTVCAPPKCRTECAEQCESKCTEPQCTWKCNPGKCDQPKCKLTCGGAQMCNFDKDLNARPPPFSNGMTVLAKGLAGMDPSALTAMAAQSPNEGAAAPAPAGAPPGLVAVEGGSGLKIR